MSRGGAYRFLVRGRVQGVGFRWFVMRAAARLQVAGYVRNLPDGQVEVCASGTAEALETLERELGKGPPSARVEYVEKQDISHELNEFKSFEVW